MEVETEEINEFVQAYRDGVADAVEYMALHYTVDSLSFLVSAANTVEFRAKRIEVLTRILRRGENNNLLNDFINLRTTQ